MKILLCYDDTKAAAEALKLSVQLAKAFNGKVLAITSLVGGGNEDADEDRKAAVQLEVAKSALEKEGVPCETHLLVRGLSSGEDIVTFAREQEVDEIIIGVRRKSKVGKFVFGSTAQHVILEAHCPVVATK